MERRGKTSMPADATSGVQTEIEFFSAAFKSHRAPALKALSLSLSVDFTLCDGVRSGEAAISFTVHRLNRLSDASPLEV